METKKVAIVTGCSEGGIGNHLCQKLAEREFIVYATSRSTSSMRNLVHPNIRRRALDVTSDSEVKSVVATVIEECGYVDVLINNAGLLVASPIIDWKSDDIKDLYDTNVISVVRLCREVVPHMAKRKSGTIVNMGSIVAELSVKFSGNRSYSHRSAAVLPHGQGYMILRKPPSIPSPRFLAWNANHSIFMSCSWFLGPFSPDSSTDKMILHSLRPRFMETFCTIFDNG